MSQTGNRKFRTLLLSALCLIAWQWVETSPVFAQRRVTPNSPPETPSQRWLPLPQGSSADLKQQVQWLQQLKGLVGADLLGGETPSLPKFDPEQMKALLDAVKQLNGGVVPGGALTPSLDGISPEQISKAMADPAMRELARKMLDQFTRDGKLPQTGEANNSQRVPFPTTSTEPGRGTSGESPDPDRSDSGAGPESSALPPAMQKLLKQLAEQAARQPNGVPPERPPFSGGSSERALPSNNQSAPSPDGQRVKPDIPPPISRSPTNDAARASSERLGAEVPRAEQSPRVDRKPARRDSSDSVPQNDPNHASRFPGADQRPAETPPAGLSAQESLEQIRKDLAGEKNTELKSAASLSPALIEKLRNALNAGDRVGPDQPSPTGPRTERPDPRGASMSPEPRTIPGPDLPDAHSGEKPPPMDVRSELEQQGFARTLRKIVEQAREESLVASSDTSSPWAGRQSGGNGRSAGLEGSVVRMLDGLRKGLVETVPEPPVPSPAPVQTPSSSTPQPVAEQRSALSQVSKAASNLLSDIVTPPAARPATVRSPHATSTSGAVNSQGTGSRSTIGLLMLLAVLGVIWYFVPHLLAAINDSRLVGSPVGGAIQPADILSRSDVVRAFHQYAMRPVTPAPAWWTHREVERHVAQTTPALRPAIQTLTDLYERARYLPDDADFTPEQIGTVRRALEQCAARPSGE